MKRRLISVICLVAAIICAVLAVNGYRKEKNAGSLVCYPSRGQ